MNRKNDAPTALTIIAEIGVNHNGSLTQAMELIDAAAESGADVAKFQHFVPEELAAKSAKLAGYQSARTPAFDSQKSLLDALTLPIHTLHELREHCRKKKIEFMASGFSERTFSQVEQMGVFAHKIPSGELNNLPLLRTVAKFNRETLISTGMGTLDEVGDAIRTLCAAGLSKEAIVVLQCTTSYPTEISSINLRAMTTMREKFGTRVGLSDHSSSVFVAAAAVALGASVIEKHLTLNKQSAGPDHFASLEPSQFSEMVSGCREVEIAMGSAVKMPQPVELENRLIVRKSIVAAKDIRRGEKLTSENLTTKRPGDGIPPSRWDEIIGKIAPKDFFVDEQIQL